MVEYSIVIPTHNRKEKLTNLLTSIRTLETKPFEIIVVDDASNDGSEEFITRMFPDVRYFRLFQEKWPGFAISYGIAKSKKNLVYIIDDDNVVDQGSVESLLRIFEGDKTGNYGVIGPVTCYLKDKNTIMYAGASYNKLTSVPKFNFAGSKFSELTKMEIKDAIIEVDGIPNAFMLRRDYAISTGLIPPYIPVQGEDGYLIYAIKRKLGKKALVCTESRIFHDYEETGRFSDVRLYYSMRTKIHFIKESFPIHRKIVNLLFLPAVFTYWALKAARSDRVNWGLSILVRGYIDGLLGVKDRKYID